MGGGGIVGNFHILHYVKPIFKFLFLMDTHYYAVFLFSSVPVLFAIRNNWGNVERIASARQDILSPLNMAQRRKKEMNQ